MKSILLLLLFFTFNSIQSKAQIYIEPTIYPPTFGLSDGAIKVDIVGYSGVWGVFIYDLTPGAPIPVVSVDSLGGLPYGAELFVAFSDSTGTSLANLILTLDDRLTEIDMITIINSTTDISCDASISVTHTFTTGVASDYEYTLTSNLPLMTSGTPAWDSLCPEIYILRAKEISTGDTLFTNRVWIKALSSSINNPTYTAFAFASVSNDTACTATASAIVIGSTAPYEFSWDGTPYTFVDSTTTFLCPGMHTLQIVDNLGDTLGLSFGVVDSSSFYMTPYPSPTIAVDTISFNTINCSFDYTTPVDSVFTTLFVVIDTNTIYYELDIWQSGVLTQVSDTVSYIYAPIPGTTAFSLTFYCGVKASGSKIYQMIDFITLDLSEVSEEEEELFIKISPNPTLGIVKIEVEELSSITIFDPTGKKIVTSTETELDLNYLKAGSYYLQIETLSGKIAYRKLILL